MHFKQLVLNILGVTRRREKEAARARQAQHEKELARAQEDSERAQRDVELGANSWRWGLHFRVDGYRPEDWLNPVFDDSTNSGVSSLLRMYLHPLASYRALGLSSIVDHWVAKVEKQGWDYIVKNHAGPGQFGTCRQWGHIEHPAFWSEIAKVLALNDTTGQYKQELLQHAGWAGNTVPFEAMPTEAIGQYSRTATTCHPRVALWLEDKGFWGNERLVPSMGPWNEVFPLQGHTFLQWYGSSKIPVAYVEDWMNAMLAHYPLTQEQKISVVGQALLAFGADAWEKHFSHSIAPYLSGIDMGLVYAVCGIPPRNAPVQGANTVFVSLEDTVVRLSQDTQAAFDPQSIDLRVVPQDNLVHKNLLLLLNVQPPSNRAQLYTIADMARKMHPGTMQASETIALPDLH